MQTLERSVEIEAPLETVFAFLTDIRNHARLSPPHTQEELVKRLPNTFWKQRKFPCSPRMEMRSKPRGGRQGDREIGR